MERSELESCQRLNKKIDHLETELVSMKTKLEQEIAQKHKLGRCMDVRSVEYSYLMCVYLCVPNEMLVLCIQYSWKCIYFFTYCGLKSKICYSVKLHSIPKKSKKGHIKKKRKKKVCKGTKDLGCHWSTQLQIWTFCQKWPGGASFQQDV